MALEEWRRTHRSSRGAPDAVRAACLCRLTRRWEARFPRVLPIGSELVLVAHQLIPPRPRDDRPEPALSRRVAFRVDETKDAFLP